MAAMTRYLQKKLLDHALGKAAYTMPTTVYLALFTADPTELGTITSEIDGGGYSRIEITSKMPMADLGSGTSSNSAPITFGPALEAWGTVSHLGVMDAEEGGSMLFHGSIGAPQIININGTTQFANNQLAITLD